MRRARATVRGFADALFRQIDGVAPLEDLFEGRVHEGGVRRLHLRDAANNLRQRLRIVKRKHACRGYTLAVAIESSSSIINIYLTSMYLYGI